MGVVYKTEDTRLLRFVTLNRNEVPISFNRGFRHRIRLRWSDAVLKAYWEPQAKSFINSPPGTPYHVPNVQVATTRSLSVAGKHNVWIALVVRRAVLVKNSLFWDGWQLFTT